MLKKRKSIEEKRLLEDYDVTYVFLSPDNVEIHYPENRRNTLNNKSIKLINNKDLRELFRDLKKSRKKEVKGAKYEI